ncbi:MAG: hypothetical protein B6D34_04710 [Candidatus Brocadia sp. UTAMX1]|jgi:hypothetical protein|nr:MAG: hypothetical protein B6D34_04710 [Candidatus Brocadia sp. UTAMX1]
MQKESRHCERSKAIQVPGIAPDCRPGNDTCMYTYPLCLSSIAWYDLYRICVDLKADYLDDRYDICHVGFITPIHHTDEHRKECLFREIKPKIKNLDPNTAIKRIFGSHFY